MIIAGISLLIAFVVIAVYHHRTKKLLQRLDRQLDQAISGNCVESTYTESYESLLEEKMNRFLTIYQQSQQKSLAEKDTVKGLISDISHQTKTPLSSILLYSQMLREQALPVEAAEMVEQLQEQSEKLDFLISTLVKTSYLENDLIQVAPALGAVDDLLYEAIQNIQGPAQQKQIVIDYQDTELQCCFDFKWTLEAIGNLLDNAVKYSPAHSTIQVKATAYEMFCRIDIQDEGIGIAEAELGQIFQRFYRSPKVAQVKGLGIGLYLVREIISAQGGYLKVTSAEGKGSCFSIFLPK